MSVDETLMCSFQVNFEICIQGFNSFNPQIYFYRFFSRFCFKIIFKAKTIYIMYNI